MTTLQSISNYIYSYDELLYRLHNKKTSDDSNKKISLPSLKVIKKNRLSVISNFKSIAEKLNRPIEHIKDYINTETGANSSINNQGQLLIQGIYNEAKCESLMRNYIREFVMCKQCKGIDSNLIKEDGLTFLECNKCFAKTSKGKI